MNDSAGAYVPAGVGGLDGYAEAFTALRKISGVVPSIMCMFGFNAGGGSYLPRQGSFVIQPSDTFFGLTGPGSSSRCSARTSPPRNWAAPRCTAVGCGRSRGRDEVAALRTVRALLNYLPDNNASWRPSRKPAIRSTARPGKSTPAEKGLQFAHRLQHAL
jgi:acetyl-CoA carboxylase carboxyltransferase component